MIEADPKFLRLAYHFAFRENIRIELLYYRNQGYFVIIVKTVQFAADRR
jgi:hypothetical protein